MGINHQVYHRYICTSAEESLVARGWRWDWYHCGVCQSRAGWMEVHRRYQWWNLMVLHCDWNIQTGGCQVLEPKFRLFRGIWTRAIQSFTTINIKKKKTFLAALLSHAKKSAKPFASGCSSGSRLTSYWWQWQCLVVATWCRLECPFLPKPWDF